MIKVIVVYKARPDFEIIYTCDKIEVLENGDVLALCTRLREIRSFRLVERRVTIVLDRVKTITIQYEDN